MIDLSIVKKYIHYDPVSGKFTRIFSRKNNLIGTVAGYVSGSEKDKRYYVQIEKKKYHAGKLAWFYMTGEWPDCEIDHRDRNPLNNQFCNLRKATHQQNCYNRKHQKRKENLPKGVTRNTRQTDKFEAAIWIDGKRKYLGLFPNQQEAADAYATAANHYHGEYKCL